MQKFYVQSGHVRWVLMAENQQAAAFRLVQTVMNESFVKGRQPLASYRLVDKTRAEDLLSKLTGKVAVGEKGFESLPQLLFDTNDLLRKWQQRTNALQRLIRNAQ